MSPATVASTQPSLLARDRVFLEPLAHGLGNEKGIAATQAVHAGDQVVGQILRLAIEPQSDQLARFAFGQRLSRSSITW